jgi:hypothetical protein
VGPFAEAVRATSQPCTFLLIVPVLAVSLSVGNRWRAALAVGAAAIVGGWLLAANRFVLDGWPLRIVALATCVAVVAVAEPTGRARYPVLANEVVAASVAASVTLAATMWWRPCVGTELGVILTEAQRGLADQLWPMAVYMLGTMVPVAIVVLAHAVVDPPERIVRAVAWVGVALGLVVAGSLVAGQHDRVVATLTRWTLE